MTRPIALKATQPKIGQGQLLAMGRLGLKESAQALRALPDSIGIIEEPGMVGNPTAHAIYEQTQSHEPQLDLSM